MLGWEVVLNSALDAGWFRGAERTEIESVFYSDFEELCKLMSITNATT